MKIVWNQALVQPSTKFISLNKPLRVLNRVFSRSADELVIAAKAYPDDLIKAHDTTYVRDVIEQSAPDGFGCWTGENLDQIMAANGVMIQAAKEALKSPGNPVLAPVSGFHHAHHARNYGYCTFNGLLVAAAALNPGGSAPRVLIIDGDGHEGDGTDDILARLPERFATVGNLTRLNAENWRRRIEQAMSDVKWDLVLYQAGADAHVDDPYGVGYLSDEAWLQRDELVFQLGIQRPGTGPLE